MSLIVIVMSANDLVLSSRPESRVFVSRVKLFVFSIWVCVHVRAVPAQQAQGSFYMHLAK